MEEPLRSSLRRRINPLVIFLLHAVTDFGFIPLLHPSVNEYEMPTVIPASIQAESLLNVRDTSGHCFQRSERYPILRTDYKCLIKRRQTNFMFQRKRSGKKKREEERKRERGHDAFNNCPLTWPAINPRNCNCERFNVKRTAAIRDCVLGHA